MPSYWPRHATLGNFWAKLARDKRPTRTLVQIQYYKCHTKKWFCLSMVQHMCETIITMFLFLYPFYQILTLLTCPCPIRIILLRAHTSISYLVTIRRLDPRVRVRYEVLKAHTSASGSIQKIMTRCNALAYL
jgi:hypothetical protein